MPPVGLLLALMSTLSLAACGDFWRNVPPRPAATDDPAVAETPYPSVNSVPARPQLSYPLQQRREIAEGLVADRANARHAGDMVRRASDRPVLTGEPVPLPPTAPASRATSAGPRPEGGLALAYVEEALARDADNGTLDDFLDRLQEPPIGPGPRSAERAAAAAAAKQAQEDRARRAKRAVTPEPSSLDDEASELQPRPDDPSQPQEQARGAEADSLATTIEPAAGSVEVPATATTEVVEASEAVELPAETAEVPAEAAAAGQIAPAASLASTTEAQTATTAPAVTETASIAAPAAPRLPLAILFAVDDAVMTARDTAKLEALARANSDAPQLFVVGNGPRPALAMERARRVAAHLVGAGIPAERLVIDMGGESDVVVVYEPDGDTG